ncbi:Putative ribonuclease H protein At1g65750 [Linum grandiflorum]
MSVLKTPASVTSRLEQLHNRFLWAGSLDKDQIHWVDWNTAKTPKRFGGLGIQDLKILNVSLLSKWTWRFATERNAWWRSLIIAKCGVGASLWIPKWDLGSAGCSIWKWVVKYSSAFWVYGCIDPGGGMCSFWYDYWIRGVNLSVVYPRIAAAAQFLGSNVFDVFSFDDRRRWSIPLTTTLRGGALLEWEQLQHRLEELPADFLTAGPASICWPLETSSIFSVRSMRNMIHSEKFSGISGFPMDIIWEKSAPTKVQGFCWMVFYGKIATLDNLQRRGMQLANRCVMCGICNETVEHLLIHCTFSAKVWTKLSSAISLFGPHQWEICDFIQAWEGMRCDSRFNDAMKVLMHATFWCLWLERNDRIFNDKVKSSQQVFHKIVWSVCSWLGAAGVFSVDKQVSWTRCLFDPG